MNEALILEIDLDDPTPAYRQIANRLRALLVAGELTPGDALPTVRRLAADLGIHHNTVAGAYRVLATEGWLELVRGRGAVVVDRAQPRGSQPGSRGFRRRLEELVAEALGAGADAATVADQLRGLATELANRSGS